jgi:hypothetical protein
MGQRGSKRLFRLDEATLRGDKNAGKRMWPGGVGGTRWCAVIEPPRCRCMCMGTSWLGHVTMGRRGLLASRPCHLNFFLNIKIRTNFIIQIGDLPDV